MIQFVISKSYLSSAKEAFTVKARSEFFITLTDKYGNDFRKKIRSTNDYKEFVSVDGQTVCASRLITAHAETAQPATTETAKRATEKPIKRFEVGKTYKSSHDYKCTVIKRTDSFISLNRTYPNGYTDTIRKKILIENIGSGPQERINLEGKYHHIRPSYLVLSLPETPSQPANTQDDSATPAETAQHVETLTTLRNRSLVQGLSPNTGNIYPSQLHVHEEAASPQNDSKIPPRIVTFYVNGYYLLPLEAEYMHYVRVVERSENTITVEDFANGDILSLPVNIDAGRYTRSEYIKRPDGKGLARNGYADRDLLGFKRSEHPRHPVFEIGKSYSATREYLGEIYTLTFSVTKRVKLKHGKNDKEQNVLLAGKMSGHPLDNPVDFAVRLYWDKPSDPEHFSQDGFTFHAENPDETPATVQEGSQPEHVDNSDALTLRLQNIPAKTVNSIVKIRCAWENPLSPGERCDYENLIPTAAKIVKHNCEILNQCPDDKIPALLATASQITLAYMAWETHQLGGPANRFRKFFLIDQRKDTLIRNYTAWELDKRKRDKAQKEAHMTLVYVPDNNYPKPQYAQYPDTIPDDIPYTVIPAVDAPQSAPAIVSTLKLAGLPRVNAAVARTWLHFIAFFLKLWLLSRLPSVPHSIPQTVNHDKPALVFRDTRNLEGAKLHKATARNARAVLNAPSQEALTAELGKLSVSAVKRIGKCLGLLHQREKGNAQSLAETLSARLFEHRTAPMENSSAQKRQQPKTYTDCKRQIVIIFD